MFTHVMVGSDDIEKSCTFYDATFGALGIGGMQLFRLESSDKSEKALPRAGQIAGAVGGIYLVLTFLCFLAYLGAEMTPFEAINHAMTTVATGGFSTHDGSIGAFVEGGADLVALVFMVLAALPFVLFLRAAQGRPDLLIFDPQARAFWNGRERLRRRKSMF